MTQMFFISPFFLRTHIRVVGGRELITVAIRIGATFNFPNTWIIVVVHTEINYKEGYPVNTTITHE